MSPVDSTLLIIGGLVLMVGLLSRLSARGPITGPLVALVLGVMVGPSGLAIVDPATWSDHPITLVEIAAEITLAIGLMGVALRLPPGYFQREWGSLAVLLGLVMPIMWLVCGLVVMAVLDVPFWLAMLVGAVLAPTDPVVSTTIVTSDLAKRAVPERLRRALSAESGANDGLAYPLVLLPMLMLEHDRGDALSEWLVRIVAWETGGAIALAVLVGYAAGRLLRKAETDHTVMESSRLAFTLALSLSVLGLANMLGTNGVLAVFVSGIAFDSTAWADKWDEYEIQEAVNRFFLLPIFVLLGAIAPWQEWAALGWRAAAIVVLVLLVRRLPAMLAVGRILPCVQRSRDAWFMGWFGPIGVAALYYASHAWNRVGAEQAWVVGSLVVCASVVVHGITARYATEWYGAGSDGTPEGDGR